MDKTFPCREGLSLTRVSFGILLALGFWFPLGFYWISNVYNKYFKSCQALDSHLLPAHGLGSIRPNVAKVRHANFNPFSCPLHPMVRHDLGGRTSRVTVQYYLGLTVQDYWSWRLKILEVDGSSRGHELRSFVDRLSSIYEACHVSLFD